MKEIELTQAKFALVDDEDYEKLIKYKWYAYKGCSTYYSGRNDYVYGKRKNILMHRVIMNEPINMLIDHIDGNGLNNCKSNLRIVTQRQNLQNRHTTKSSQYAGVYWKKDAKKWIAKMYINKKHKYIGSFDTEEEAHKAYLSKLEDNNELFVDNI
jgi:hypothetical protein